MILENFQQRSNAIMKLSEEIKLEIKKEFEEFKHKMYDGNTL